MVSGRGPIKAMPAASTLAANPWFSERKPYLSPRTPVAISSIPAIEKDRSCSPRMNHIHPMLQRNPHNIILTQIRRHGRQPLPHLISLIRLLPMRGHLVLDRVDGDRLHGQFVGGSEDTDGDFTAVGDEEFFEGAGVAGLFLAEGLDAEGRVRSASGKGKGGLGDVRMNSGSAGSSSGTATWRTRRDTRRSRRHGLDVGLGGHDDGMCLGEATMMNDRRR